MFINISPHVRWHSLTISLCTSSFTFYATMHLICLRIAETLNFFLVKTLTISCGWPHSHQQDSSVAAVEDADTLFKPWGAIYSFDYYCLQISAAQVLEKMCYVAYFSRFIKTAL